MALQKQVFISYCPEHVHKAVHEKQEVFTIKAFAGGPLDDAGLSNPFQSKIYFLPFYVTTWMRHAYYLLGNVQHFA